MNPFVIFQALKDKRSLKIGIISALIITIVYFAFSLVLGLVSIGKWYDESFLLIAQFAILKSFSGFRFIDWILFFGLPLSGGLLFANYRYWRCKGNSAANIGLVAGLFAATCPACILPILGLASIATTLFNISLFIKISALVIIIASTYFVIYKQQKCKVKQ